MTKNKKAHEVAVKGAINFQWKHNVISICCSQPGKNEHEKYADVIMMNLCASVVSTNMIVDET